ncbi:MAG TPA: hypothetical protein VH934_07800 [Xanthobacteraceae bacterium]
MTLLQTSEAAITTDDLQPAIVDIGDESIFIGGVAQQAAESSRQPRVKPYWFRCPACNFDWREWLRPSIIFISLSFITDRCPNCRRKNVRACRMGSGHQDGQETEL